MSMMTITRQCGVCGKKVTTSADTPLKRRVGREQTTTYFCGWTCKRASYLKIDETEQLEQIRASDREYYRRNREKCIESAKGRYAADRENILEYQRRKRKLGATG